VGAGEGGRGGGGMIPWQMIGAFHKIEQSGNQKYLSFITSEQPTFRSISSMAYPINTSNAPYRSPLPKSQKLYPTYFSSVLNFPFFTQGLSRTIPIPPPRKQLHHQNPLRQQDDFVFLRKGGM